MMCVASIPEIMDVAVDATTAFAIKGADNTYYSAEQIHNVSLATLDDEFATVLTTEELIKKLRLTEKIQS